MPLGSLSSLACDKQSLMTFLPLVVSQNFFPPPSLSMFSIIFSLIMSPSHSLHKFIYFDYYLQHSSIKSLSYLTAHSRTLQHLEVPPELQYFQNQIYLTGCPAFQMDLTSYQLLYFTDPKYYQFSRIHSK